MGELEINYLDVNQYTKFENNTNSKEWRSHNEYINAHPFWVIYYSDQNVVIIHQLKK